MKSKEIIILTVLLFLVFWVYLSTTHPVFKNNDSPETSIAAFTLGIGHPPGYPLFTLIAKIFTLIPLANPNFRVNLFSIFLSIIILFISYFFVKNRIINGRINLFEKRFVSFISIFILSFSFLFWNQAIEAKGGIYILNFLFFVILTDLAIKIIENYRNKYFYLFLYIYGLSLSNHWPSMIIFFPFLIFFFIKNISKIKLKQYFFILLFFIVGISPYLFLFIRAKTEPILNWGDPSNIKNFLWVVLRKGYIYPVKPGIEVILYQVKEFIKLYITNYNLLWIFSIIGIIHLFKNNKKNLLFYLIIFFTIVFAVIFYNRTQKDLLWQMDIFLLPAEYIVFILIIIGLNVTLNYKKHKLYKTIIILFSFIFILIIFKNNFIKNNNSRDYILYDYGKNILETVDKDGCYIGDGDYNLMPVYYFQHIKKIRQDIKFVTVSFLIFKWGIDDFIKKYDNIKMKPFDTNNNIKNIIEFYKSKVNIYLSNYFPRLNEIDINMIKNQKGILLKLSDKRQIFSSEIFKLYSYRGIYEKFCILNKMNRDLIGWYPVSMVNQANELSSYGKFDDAINLYKKALLFPIDKPESNIYYNISLAYKGKNDIYNQLIYIIKACEKTNDAFILEEGILLCYYTGFLTKIKSFMKKLQGSKKSENIAKINDILTKLNDSEKYEIMLIKANEFMNNNNYQIAKLLYENLIEKKYKIDIIYRNIGVYYFKTENYLKALEYFKLSQNETQNPEIYVYIAFTQYKIGDKKGAIETIKQGLQLFKDDKQLRDLLIKMEKEVLRK